jgi:hypothetical protein
MLFKDVVELNARSPILVTLLGIVIVAKEVASRNAPSPILVTELGMVTEVRELVPLNTNFPISVTPLGITNEAIFVFAKAASPITSSADSEPKVTLARDVALANACSPIAVTLAGIVMVAKRGALKNA